MRFAEKQHHPWISRSGERQCRWVLPNGDGFSCCTWREGHPKTVPHEIVSDQIFENPQERWVYRPDLSIFNTPVPAVISLRSEQGWFERIARWFFGVRS